MIQDTRFRIQEMNKDLVPQLRSGQGFMIYEYRNNSNRVGASTVISSEARDLQMGHKLINHGVSLINRDYNSTQRKKG